MPPKPACRINPEFKEDVESNAMCLIRIDQSMLVIKHRLSGDWDIPGGINQEGESAQCTAHRETFEETGLNVLVGRRLGVLMSSGYVYECFQQAGLTAQDKTFDSPGWAKAEVVEISLIDPYTLHPNDWRFGDQLIEIRDMFTLTDPALAPQDGELPEAESLENNK